jgi:GNAT superfamily N-acetyltransferase
MNGPNAVRGSWPRKNLPPSPAPIASPATTSLRAATAADVPLILQLIRALAEYERAPNDVVATEELLREHLFGDAPAAHVLLACEESEPVGFALYFLNYSTWLGRPGLYLEDLFVLPAHRRSGHGRALLQRLGQIAHERGCGRMEWAVLDWNEPAIDFYKTLGAQPLNEWTIFRLTGEGIAKLAQAAADPAAM